MKETTDWKLRHLGLFIGLFLVYIFTVSIGFEVLENVFPILSWEKNPYMISFFYLLQVIGELGIIYLLGKKHITSWKKSVGIQYVPFISWFIIPFCVYIGYIMTMTSVLVILSLVGIQDIPGITGEGTNMTELLGNSQIAFVLSFIITVLIAPVIEEIVFRGFIYSAILSRCTPWIAIIATSAIFALSHGTLGVIIPLFILGLILTTLRHTQKSIVPGIAFHILNNLMAYVFLLTFPR